MQIKPASQAAAAQRARPAAGHALDAAGRARVVAITTAFKHRPGPLLEVLHAVQAEFGYVPADAVPLMAEVLNLSRAEVHGVISFYHHFRGAPAGRHTVQLCRAEACQSMRGRALEAHATRRLGIAMHATTADGAVTLEPVYCLGNCALAPALLIDGELHGRVDAARFDALIEPLLAPGGPGRDDKGARR
jgi:formate dehydrogenase subunit gamma